MSPGRAAEGKRVSERREEGKERVTIEYNRDPGKKKKVMVNTSSFKIEKRT
jgi:hypothetical protein